MISVIHHGRRWALSRGDQPCLPAELEISDDGDGVGSAPVRLRWTRMPPMSAAVTAQIVRDYLSPG
jgi:hypothetical protein